MNNKKGLIWLMLALVIALFPESNVSAEKVEDNRDRLQQVVTDIKDSEDEDIAYELVEDLGYKEREDVNERLRDKESLTEEEKLIKDALDRHVRDDYMDFMVVVVLIFIILMSLPILVG